MQARKSFSLIGSIVLLLVTSIIVHQAQTAPVGDRLVDNDPHITRLIPLEAQSIEQTVWPDTIVVVEQPSATVALDQLETGDLDGYAYQITDPALAQRIADSPNLDGYRSAGNCVELTLNPAGPVFAGSGKLNPFAVPRIREALNRLVDRDHIVQEYYAGLASPRWLPLHTISADYAQLADAARALELEYSYDLEWARQTIAQEMAALGATPVGGHWHYQGEPVEIIFLIRVEDERLQIGDYVSDQLEAIGFTVDRLYMTASEASQLWLNGDPNDGLWHIYTGGWVASVIHRDEADTFESFYTPRGLGVPLWQAYTPTPEFDELAGRLASGDYDSLAERRTMMVQALEWAQEDSVRVWLVDKASITPRRTEVRYVSDLFGGLNSSSLWPYTLRREGAPGGSVTMTLALPDVFSDPWNPLDGSNW
jgi:peptide/nickel transport system substrate-binding protein